MKIHGKHNSSHLINAGAFSSFLVFLKIHLFMSSCVCVVCVCVCVFRGTGEARRNKLFGSCWSGFLKLSSAL